MSKIDDFTRLKHIRDSAKEALSFVNNRTREDLDRDRMLSLALVIPFLCEAAYINPRLRRPPLPRGDYRGVLIMCIFIQNWYKIN
jgi:uncharacterized protein with HEPN domain